MPRNHLSSASGQVLTSGHQFRISTPNRYPHRDSHRIAASLSDHLADHDGSARLLALAPYENSQWGVKEAEKETSPRWLLTCLAAKCAGWYQLQKCACHDHRGDLRPPSSVRAFSLQWSEKRLVCFHYCPVVLCSRATVEMILIPSSSIVRCIVCAVKLMLLR